MTSTDNQLTMGVIRVNLSEQIDLDSSGSTIDALGESQTDRFEHPDNTSNVENDISNKWRLHTWVAITRANQVIS